MELLRLDGESIAPVARCSRSAVDPRADPEHDWLASQLESAGECPFARYGRFAARTRYVAAPDGNDLDTSAAKG